MSRERRWWTGLTFLAGFITGQVMLRWAIERELDK
jgi:hypothetical protein